MCNHHSHLNHTWKIILPDIPLQILSYLFKIFMESKCSKKLLCLTLLSLAGLTPLKSLLTLCINIGRSRGACPAHASLWDPILSFSHTFSPKSAHIGGACPPLWEILDLPLINICKIIFFSSTQFAYIHVHPDLYL